MIEPIAPPPGSTPVSYPAGAALTRSTVRDALAAHLAGKLAPVPVYATRMLPVQNDEFPLVSVYAPSNSKRFESRAGGDFWFTAAVSITVQAKVEGEDETEVDAALDELELAIEESVLRDASWMEPNWSPGDVRTETSIEMQADRPIGHLSTTFEIEVSMERFQPFITDNLATVGLRVDLIDPFDRLGTYAGQPTPPPRASGPEGRIEIGATITLPEG